MLHQVIVKDIAQERAAGPGPVLDRGRSLVLSRHWPELAALGGVLVTFLLIRNMQLHHDAVWQLWIGRQLLHGVGLYSEILELNPPLWFWMAIPLVGLAELTGLSEASVMIGFMMGSVALSVTLFAALIADKPAQTRFALLGALVLACTLNLLDDFGQREHFTLVAALPYVALIARRMEGHRVSLPLALSIGLFAATGFALKHYFALAPLLLEAFFFWQARRSYTPLRPETIVIGLAAAAYAVATILFAPEFIRTMVPMVGLAYEGYERPLWVQFRVTFFQMAPLAICACVIAGRPRSTLAKAAFVAAFAFLIGYFLQNKGWRYHAVPMTGLLFVGIVAEICARRAAAEGAISAQERKALYFLVPALAFPVLLALFSGPYSNTHRELTERALRGLDRGDSVLALSANASALWPMVEEQGLVFPSRHFTFWMLPTIARKAGDPEAGPRLAALGHRIRRETVEDIACHVPRRVMVDSHKNSMSFRGVKFDTLAFFQRDPDFARFFSAYRYTGEYGRLSVYERVGAVVLPKPARCRPIF